MKSYRNEVIIEMKDLYTPDGWLNIPAIARLGAWLNVITGPRQVGKTYGTLKYMIEEKRPFILMRRTVEEVQFLGINQAVNPFAVYRPEHEITLDRAGKILNIKEDDEILGICLGLPTVATIRGFAASRFTDIVFDEFIPEKHVVARKTEGDALLNAYTTINGNRELEGRPPVRLWLLANSNNINSPILSALGLVDPLLQMREKGREIWQRDGVLIVQPKSGKIIEQRRQTAMMQHLTKAGSAERFTGMALENEFSYNDQTLVGKMPLSGLKPLTAIGRLYFWQRSDGFLYVCRATHKTDLYNDSEFNREQFRDDYWWLFDQYRAGQIKFADLHLVEMFKTLFNIHF